MLKPMRTMHMGTPPPQVSASRLLTRTWRILTGCWRVTHKLLPPSREPRSPHRQVQLRPHHMPLRSRALCRSSRAYGNELCRLVRFSCREPRLSLRHSRLRGQRAAQVALEPRHAPRAAPQQAPRPAGSPSGFGAEACTSGGGLAAFEHSSELTCELPDIDSDAVESYADSDLCSRALQHRDPHMTAPGQPASESRASHSTCSLDTADASRVRMEDLLEAGSVKAMHGVPVPNGFSSARHELPGSPGESSLLRQASSELPGQHGSIAMSATLHSRTLLHADVVRPVMAAAAAQSQAMSAHASPAQVHAPAASEAEVPPAHASKPATEYGMRLQRPPTERARPPLPPRTSRIRRPAGSPARPAGKQPYSQADGFAFVDAEACDVCTTPRLSAPRGQDQSSASGIYREASNDVLSASSALWHCNDLSLNPSAW
jgi:hypothetical protein